MKVTYRICRLLDTQKQALLNLLLYNGDETPPSPLPIIPTEENDDRVDPEEPILETGIYRDPWERKDRPVANGDARMRDVFSSLDWPRRLNEKSDSHGRALFRLLKAREEAAGQDDSD